MAAPVPDAAAPVPVLVTPVWQVIALLQDMLTPVTGADGQLTQLQYDLVAFLFGMAGVEPVMDPVGGIDNAGLSAAANASMASRLSLIVRLAGSLRVPVTGNAAGFAPLGGIVLPTFCATTQACRASSLPGMAPLAPSSATSMDAQLFFGSASSEVLLSGPMSGVGGLMILNAAGVLPVSLAALAALALPGAGGLTLLTAAGVHVGYRQAKAGFALRTARIAGFARPGAGPLGVVRSGSLVVIHPRPLPVARPGALSARRLLDKVA